MKTSKDIIKLEIELKEKHNALVETYMLKMMPEEELEEIRCIFEEENKKLGCPEITVKRAPWKTRYHFGSPHFQLHWGKGVWREISYEEFVSESEYRSDHHKEAKSIIEKMIPAMKKKGIL